MARGYDNGSQICRLDLKNRFSGVLPNVRRGKRNALCDALFRQAIHGIRVGPLQCGRQIIGCRKNIQRREIEILIPFLNAYKIPQFVLDDDVIQCGNIAIHAHYNLMADLFRVEKIGKLICKPDGIVG
jgi:hypothetical protein